MQFRGRVRVSQYWSLMLWIQISFLWDRWKHIFMHQPYRVHSNCHLDHNVRYSDTSVTYEKSWIIDDAIATWVSWQLFATCWEILQMVARSTSWRSRACAACMTSPSSAAPQARHNIFMSFVIGGKFYHKNHCTSAHCITSTRYSEAQMRHWWHPLY